MDYTILWWLPQPSFSLFLYMLVLLLLDKPSFFVPWTKHQQNVLQLQLSLKAVSVISLCKKYILWYYCQTLCLKLSSCWEKINIQTWLLHRKLFEKLPGTGMERKPSQTTFFPKKKSRTHTTDWRITACISNITENNIHYSSVLIIYFKCFIHIITESVEYEEQAFTTFYLLYLQSESFS